MCLVSLGGLGAKAVHVNLLAILQLKCLEISQLKGLIDMPEQDPLGLGERGRTPLPQAKGWRSASRAHSLVTFILGLGVGRDGPRQERHML